MTWISMKKSIDAARRRDQKTSRAEAEHSAHVQAIRGFSHGNVVSAITSEEIGALQTYSKLLREKWEPNVIRRSGTLVDNNGDQILGLQPYIEQLIIRNLYDHEAARFEDTCREVIKDLKHGMPFTQSDVSVLESGLLTCPAGWHTVGGSEWLGIRYDATR